MFMPSSVCYAEDANSDNFERFSTYYYLNPEPQKLPTVLENFFKSEAFSDEQVCDEHCKNITSYFFARAIGAEQNLIENYKSLFENGTHKQRTFLLKVFRLCGDDGVRTFLKSKFKRESFY